MVCFACLSEDPYYRICLECRTKFELLKNEKDYYHKQYIMVNQQNYILKKELGKLREERGNSEDEAT